MRAEPDKRNRVCLCDAAIEDEFIASHFLFQASDPADFVRSQWSCFGSWPYPLYRVVIALGFLAWLPYDYWYNLVTFNNGHPLTWFLYATNWTLLGITLTVTLHAAITIYYTRHPQLLEPDTGNNTLPCSIMFYWINAAICHNATIVISVCFWAAIMVLPHQALFEADASQVKHSLICCYVLLDTFISAYPVRIFHVVYALACMLLYVAFNGIYFAAGGIGPDHHHYVYYQLQWRHVGESIITIMLTLLMAIVAQLILYTVSCCRRVLFNCCHQKTEEEKPILSKEETEPK